MDIRLWDIGRRKHATKEIGSEGYSRLLDHASLLEKKLWIPVYDIKLTDIKEWQKLLGLMLLDLETIRRYLLSDKAGKSKKK